MNIHKLIANLTALEEKVSALKTSNDALQAQVTAIDHRINSLVVCDGPPTKKQKTEPTTPPAPILTDEPIDWLTRGMKAVEGAVQKKCISATYGKTVTKTWASVMDGRAPTTDVKAEWSHLLAWCQSIAHDDTRKTRMGQIKTVFKYMQVEYDNDFDIAHDKLKNQLKAQLEYHQKLEDELEQFKCADGSYLTNAKLRTFYATLPESVSDFHRMQLAFVIFHGNRAQDWEVGFGKQNAGEHGYYDPDTATMYVTKRKTDAIREGNTIVGYRWRQFKVHPEVQEAIKRFHTDKASVWLIPQEKDPTKCCKAMCKNIQRKFFAGPDKGKWGEDNPNPYGFPLKVDLTFFRHLYETHIRYVDPMPKDQLEATMRSIGHSNTTAIKRYSEMFRLMHQPAQE